MTKELQAYIALRSFSEALKNNKVLDNDVVLEYDTSEDDNIVTELLRERARKILGERQC